MVPAVTRDLGEIPVQTTPPRELPEVKVRLETGGLWGTLVLVEILAQQETQVFREIEAQLVPAVTKDLGVLQETQV